MMLPGTQVTKNPFTPYEPCDSFGGFIDTSKSAIPCPT